VSGNACLIIIRGNKSQSLARSFANQFAHDDILVAAANDTQAIAQSLCTLSSGYAEDGVWEELMTDQQKQTATDLMESFNTSAEPLIGTHGDNHSVALVLNAFNLAGLSLLEAIIDNP
jgi:hypothetical protein